MTQDLNICPKCGGPADQGHDRCVPPSAYWCSECQEKSEMEPTHWWNPKYPTTPNQLTKPYDGGGWDASYSADQLRAAKVQVLREAAGYRYMGASDAKLLHDMADELEGQV